MTSPSADIPHIVIFDLDETLTQKGTWGRFVISALKDQPFKYIPFVIGTALSQLKYSMGFGPRAQVKEHMMRWTISGMKRERLEAMAEKFADFEAGQGLRPKAKSVIDRHKSQGHRLIIASAAVDLIVKPIAHRLDIGEYICTSMAYTDDDRLAKKLGSKNCYGQGKLDMVKEYLAAQSTYVRQSTKITVYSDSSSDLPILKWACNGIAVNPSKKLKKIAAPNGLTIQCWN